MIDVYFWPTGNGKKITIMLEECGLEYRIIPINIGKGDQHTPEFTRISPSNKMPAIVDHGAEGGRLSMFESGAILVYLAEKTGRLLPETTRERFKVLQWLFWQVGGLGPSAGQAHYFLRYAPHKNEEGMRRFRNEVARLYGVMDRQLGHEEYLGGEYSIADIAAWPWVFRHEWQEQDLDDFPNVKRWFDAVGGRPAVVRGAAVGQDLVDRSARMPDEEKKLLFGLDDQDFERD
ncbi:MAG TPA: glutathione S-transferase C-terminal domain-containing protein [Woeseiaceae bacterium]